MNPLLKTHEHEVDRASYQMVNHGISLIFFHTNNQGTIEYRMESLRGGTLATKTNPRGTFQNFVLACIKVELADRMVSA
jgi:hypothetical protein